MEVLVVLAIISLLIGMGLMHITSESFRLQSEVRNFRSVLVRAKGEAVRRNASVSVYFQSSSYEVRLTGDAGVLLAGTLPANITIVTKDQTQLIGVDSFSFTGIGTARNHHVRIKNSKNNYSIRVNSTGRILLDGPQANAS